MSILINDPFLLFRELNKLYYSIEKGFEYNKEGIDVFTEDWDNLVLLDACRYDTFVALHSMEGRLTMRQSRGSNTHEFLQGNVKDKDLRDSVYITANPMYYRHEEWFNAQFHEVINVWLEDGWDDEFNTVLPETMTTKAIDAAHEYQDKRLIIHYIQPHAPFICENIGGSVSPDPHSDRNIWTELRKGSLLADVESVTAAYEDNFRRVMESVTDLISSLEGKTIITSDHGNMIGERAAPIPIREWGHPRGIYTPQLVTVPWLVLDHQERRNVTYENSTGESKKVENGTVADRLSSLGYLDH